MSTHVVSPVAFYFRGRAHPGNGSRMKYTLAGSDALAYRSDIQDDVYQPRYLQECDWGVDDVEQDTPRSE